jgi:hypothetical protein
LPEYRNIFKVGIWGDEGMLQEHYVLKSVRALRNATAHNHCILNGLTRAEAHAGYGTPQVIIDSLNDAGMSRTKTRRTKLSNLRVAQMAATLFCLSTLCTSESAKRRHAARLASVRDAYQGHMARYRLNSSFVSFFDFPLRLAGFWLPREA